jgi:hypothetical protein
MTLFALNGPGPAALMPQVQVTAPALQMQGILQVGLRPLEEKGMAFGAALHRLALALEVAPAMVDMMAPDAGDFLLLRATVAEGRQRLFPSPQDRHLQTLAGLGSVTGPLAALNFARARPASQTRGRPGDKAPSSPVVGGAGGVRLPDVDPGNPHAVLV